MMTYERKIRKLCFRDTEGVCLSRKPSHFRSLPNVASRRCAYSPHSSVPRALSCFRKRTGVWYGTGERVSAARGLGLSAALRQVSEIRRPAAGLVLTVTSGVSPSACTGHGCLQPQVPGPRWALCRSNQEELQVVLLPQVPRPRCPAGAQPFADHTEGVMATV